MPMPANLAVSDTHYQVNYLGKAGITGARWRVHAISRVAGEGPSSDWMMLTFDNTPYPPRPVVSPTPGGRTLATPVIKRTGKRVIQP